MDINYEIERKYLISYPDMDMLEANASKTEIVQTYLRSEDGKTARVRKRGINGEYIYYHTVKQKISSVRRIEDERVVTEEEYEELLKNADTSRNVVYKTRYCLEYKGQMFEIDVYPFWRDRAIMEIELDDESQAIEFPPCIEIIREVTDDKRYTNASIAKAIPDDVLRGNKLE